MPDVAERIVALRKAAHESNVLRAQAEGALKVAHQQLAQADEGLRKLGVNPDNAEEELAALTAQLEQTVADLEAGVKVQTETSQRILEAARKAGLV